MPHNIVRSNTLALAREKRQKGSAAKLQKHQNGGLRHVLGAFKATPIRQLETEAYVPLLDPWLNGRIARFQARLERTGLARQIRDACTAIKMQLRLPAPAQDPERTATGYPSYSTRLGAVHTRNPYRTALYILPVS
jgi:hypothetical protein